MEEYGKDLLKILTKLPSKGDQDAFFEKVLTTLSQALSAMNKAITTRLAQLKDGKDGRDGKDGPPGRDGRDGRNGVDGKDGKNADEVRITEDILRRLPPPPFLEPETVRDKLETLKGDDRLDASAIKGLDEYVKKSTTRTSTVFAISRGQIKLYDLSDQLDGSTSTFSLPAFWRVITVHLSSYPTPPRPTIDWTTDASAMTITFTGNVDPATSLAAGQTCLVEYAEP